MMRVLTMPLMLICRVGSITASGLLDVEYSLVRIWERGLLLRTSYVLKLIVSGLGGVAIFSFVAFAASGHLDRAAVSEWLIAFLWITYMATFVLDMLELPDGSEAPRKKHKHG